jgi:3-methylcrotonyl-CoA carboxylase alpha subunit
LGLADLVRDAEVWPIHTNATFLHALLVQPDFARGNVDTSFIEAHADEVVFDVDPPEWLLSTVAERLACGGPLTGFRLNREPNPVIHLSGGKTEYAADLTADVSYDQRHYPVFHSEPGAVFATMQGQTWRFTPARVEGAPGGSAADGAIFAPMPGKVIAVDVTEGQPVEAGQRLMVLEAMKMEHALTAPFAGTVAELAAREGQQVQVEALLARVEKAQD